MRPIEIARARKDQRTVLIVDDDRSLLDLMRDLLEEQGYTVTGLSSAESAHSRIATEQPDLVILDLKLGSIEAGWGILDVHILDPLTRSIPVVLCSGEVDSIRARSAALLPEYRIGVLTKPFDIDSLLSVVEDALRGRVTIPTSASPTPQPNPLSPREVEVARLVAEGLTNAEIASRLCLTRGTARNHVEHILQKLELSNRAQIATWVTGTLGSIDTQANVIEPPLWSWQRGPRPAAEDTPRPGPRQLSPEPPRAG